jgi:hypothetical protein
LKTLFEKISDLDAFIYLKNDLMFIKSVFSKDIFYNNVIITHFMFILIKFYNILSSYERFINQK